MRKCFVFLIALALLVTAGIFAVSAETGAPTDAVYCERCRKNVPADEWSEWTATGGDFLQEGHFYLADTYLEQESTINIVALKFVCLDLRGNTWITEGISMFNIIGDLSIMDSVGGGTILTTGATGKPAFANVDAVGALNLFGGTVQRVVRDDIKILQGGLIYIAGGTVNVCGGTVTGGVVAGASSDSPYGGNIYMSGGALDISSGTVSKGMSYSGKYTYGGNIYATDGATVTVSGGTVEDGFATTAGGNMYIQNASLTVTAGVIRNGCAYSRGGNVMFNPAAAGNYKINVSGGTITGGVVGGGLQTFADKTDDSTLNPTCVRGTYGGGNFYVRAAFDNNSVAVSGGVIDGDFMVDQAKSFTLSGAPKIGLGKSSGLQYKQTYTNSTTNALDSKDSSPVKTDVTGLTDGAEIYVQAGGTFTTAIPETDVERILGYFKPAIRTTLSVSSNQIKGANGTQGYCPHCKELVTWTAATKASTDGEHCYLSASVYGSGHLTIDKSTVLDLNGHSIYREGGRIIFNSAATSGKYFVLMDSWGGGKLEGSGTNEEMNKNGGVLYVGGSSTFDLYSGTIRMATSLADSTATSNVLKGGTLHVANNATANIRGGQITGGKITRSSGVGANIAMVGTGNTLKIYGGIIRGGTATALNGGNIYAEGKVEISGGWIYGGSAKYGGNIYSTKEITMTGGVVWGGKGTSGSGNIYAYKATITGGVIGNGQATGGGGGNLRLGDSTSTISGNAVIHSGKATSNGGNVYLVQNLTLDIQGGLIAGGTADKGGNIHQNTQSGKNSCVLNISGGHITMGSATNGGNIYVRCGTFAMTGGAVSVGTAENGGNIYFNMDADYELNAAIKDDGNDKTALPEISFGKATTGHGGNIAFMTGADTTPTTNKYKVQLGNCVVRDGSATGNGRNLYINEKAKFEVLPEFAQNTTVYFHSDLFKDDIILDSAYVFCDGVFSGTLLLENRSNLPKIVTVQADPALVIGVTALVMKDETVQWYGSNEEAMNSYTADVAYIQPASGVLPLGSGSYIVDLAGQNVTINGTADTAVNCFDSVNATSGVYGVATFNGPVLQNMFQFNTDGATYITLKESDNSYSFHCLAMDVSSISFRPGSAGIYYSCDWICDSALKEKLVNFGVAVSIINMPGTDFATDGDTIYTEFSAKDLDAGKQYNSVLINEIFSGSATNNADRGATAIYAAPYATVLDAEGVVQSVVSQDEVSYSLKSVLDRLDKEAYYANKPALESFHQKWEKAMENWAFANIGVKPQDDNVLRILMGGNSFAYYYVEELYGLLMENRPEGVDEVEIYNIYSSGRGMYTHWKLWSTQAEGDYYLFLTDKNGRRGLNPSGGWTLEEALAVANWDYVGLQGVGKSSIGDYANAATLDAKCEDLAIYAEALFGRIYEMFPYTQFLWHRTWAQEVGRVTDSGFVYTEEYNERYDPGMQYVCDYMTEVFDQDKPYDLVQVNSGAAWKEARRLNAELIAAGGEEAGLLPYGGLCAMLSRNTYGDKRPGSGDGQHDGDIGGGQLLNAYMWYMTITGDSDLTDNEFKPDYEMSDGLWNMLKQAAMTTYETYYTNK